MGKSITVNNELYDRLGERWYEADDDPVALLRAEHRLTNPWIRDHLAKAFPEGARLIDIGCGAGFLSNELAAAGHHVVGLDASTESLAVAKRHDASGRASYERGDATHLPFSDESFDVATAMDFLEHVEDPEKVVREAARVLRPGGLFFFHTFNRNLLAWLVIIKCVEWFVPNTEPNLHVLRLFVKPDELRRFGEAAGLETLEMRGTRLAFSWTHLFERIQSGRIPKELAFRFTSSLLLGYVGCMRKR